MFVVLGRGPFADNSCVSVGDGVRVLRARIYLRRDKLRQLNDDNKHVRVCMVTLETICLVICCE